MVSTNGVYLDAFAFRNNEYIHPPLRRIILTRNIIFFGCLAYPTWVITIVGPRRSLLQSKVVGHNCESVSFLPSFSTFTASARYCGTRPHATDPSHCWRTVECLEHGAVARHGLRASSSMKAAPRSARPWVEAKRIHGRRGRLEQSSFCSLSKRDHLPIFHQTRCTMAGVGRSIKQSSLLSPRLMRPGHPRRTLSSSSELSSAASSPRSEDPFVFSVGHTPAHEEPPAPNSSDITPMASSAATRDKQVAIHDSESHRPRNSARPSRHDWPDFSTSPRSRPIAIELPPPRKPSTASVDTPPEPLSARGDVIGGYFPLHENPTCRIYKPHPFHLDVTKARHQSLSQAASYGSLPPTQRELGSPSTMAESMHAAKASSPLGRLHLHKNIDFTSTTSYLPSSVHENALPMGKYYPSNYEASRRSQHSQLPSPAPSANPASFVGTLKPSLGASNYHRSSQCRSDSDATRRLQQYQRDMIAQATLAASHVLGTVDRVTGANVAASASLHGAPIQTLQLGGAMIDRSKPTAPKLIPIGSPGPVTPMDLDGADGYLTTDMTAAVADAVRDGEAVARVVQAE